MYKATYKQIKCLYEVTNWSNGVFEKDQQVDGHQIAYFSPSDTNWAYRIELVKKDNSIYEVVTVFGGVKAYRELIF